MSGITTHVLDTARGRPAAGVPVTLAFRASGFSTPGSRDSGIRDSGEAGESWPVIGRGTTDPDGRLRTLTTPDALLAEGTYRITFDTAAYFASLGVVGFYPEVTIVFEVRSAAEHYHVPLLLQPFGYATYRGS